MTKTEIREADLVNFSASFLSKPAGRFFTADSIAIVEKITVTSPEAIRRATMMGRSPRVTTAYRVTVQMDNGQDRTFQVRRADIKIAR